MRLSSGGYNAGIFGLELESDDIYGTEAFQTFAKRVLKFVTDEKRCTLRQIRSGLPQRTVNLVPDARDYEYWITLALRWYSAGIARSGTLVTTYYIPCPHGNDPGLCMEIECMGKWKKRTDAGESTLDKPYLHPASGKKTEKVGKIRI